MGPISYPQVEELRDALDRRDVKYLLIGQTAAIIYGFPDTTQDADLFVQKTPANGTALVKALEELGFRFTARQAAEIRRGKDFIQLKNGPFDVDVVFAPDGIERFEDAWGRGSNIEGFPVCSIDDIIASKQAANRAKDRQTLPRLKARSSSDDPRLDARSGSLCRWKTPPVQAHVSLTKIELDRSGSAQ